MNKEDKEIMYDSDEAAKFVTGISGWVSSNGQFWGKNERAARYDGSTHSIGDCGHKTKKPYTICEDCRNKKSVDKYKDLPEIEWDGITPLCLWEDDKYFFDEDDILGYCEDNDLEPESLRLCICIPNRYTKVTSEAIAPEDVSPEDYDGYLPKTIQEALDNLNKIIAEYENPFTWSQGKHRVTVHIDTSTNPQ